MPAPIVLHFKKNVFLHVKSTVKGNGLYFSQDKYIDVRWIVPAAGLYKGQFVMLNPICRARLDGGYMPGSRLVIEYYGETISIPASLLEEAYEKGTGKRFWPLP